VTRIQDEDRQVEPDPRLLKLAKTEFKKACQSFARTRSPTAFILEDVAKSLGWMLTQQLIPETTIYEELRAACVQNHLAEIDSSKAIDACIRRGLEIGRKLPAPTTESDHPLPKRPKDPTGAARSARWKARHREKYNEYQRAYMRWRYAKRRMAG
jgi:hypothetical protein